ncbi:protein phosphatase 2C domain-containing protein [Streptomyces sp. CT34]|uniref:protein phosphatase 2C domain-containing protein n=1 Tax=Streptomyces sp. CT34 TaxID=1553907 RepID=UPI0006896126|nr:protein phosphatase 2C domain-containing protein [Streptomyces sp. CT34]
MLPAADPDALDALAPDTVLDGAGYGSVTLRAVSQRGAAGREHGELRRDALLTARFGTGRDALLLVAVATGLPAAGRDAHHAARDACAWIGGAGGRNATRLAEDIRADRRDALTSGLQRLTGRTYGQLRGRAAELGVPPEEYTAALRCLLVPAAPGCRTRVFFGVGAGGIFRLRNGAWRDLEPPVADAGTGAAPGPPGAPGARRARHAPSGPGTAGRPDPFLFRATLARPGDTLLLCTPGLADPWHGAPGFAARLAGRWSDPRPPGLTDFLTDTQTPLAGHTEDRTAVGVWES